MASTDNSKGHDELLRSRPPPETTLMSNVLLPAVDGSYSRKDILLKEGKIARIAETQTIQVIDGYHHVDCSDKMLLPGFVNAHTHSIEHWSHGLIKPLPLELWVLNLIQHEPRGIHGWHGKDSFHKTPASALTLSALQCGLESILSGCTAIMDHIFTRHMDDIEAVVKAYRALGIRAYIAPLLDDDRVLFANYIPLVHDAKERNEKDCESGVCSCGGMGDGGKMRVEKGSSDPEKTKWALALWEEAVQKFHRPEEGIEIVIGPVTAYSCSTELWQGAVELRKKYDLCGHSHLLETRAQALQAKQFFPSGSAVKHLKELGFLDRNLRGTSFAHTVWLTEEEYDIVAEEGATCVHNPLSNLRLGSGAMPVVNALRMGVSVAVGCDGSCSSDGQDMLEALKMGTFLSAVTTPDYKDWLTPHRVALDLAAKNGYRGIGMEGKGGEIKEGMVADVTLWDLSTLALLPRTDPLSLLVQGSRTQAPGAGSTMHSAWVNGEKIIENGSPTGINIEVFRKALIDAQPDYRCGFITDPKQDPLIASAEVEYRAAMGLDRERQTLPMDESLGSFPQGRVFYDSTIN